MIHNVKLYISAVCTEILLFTMNYLDALDEGLKRGLNVAGLIVAVLTAMKLYNDIVNGQLDRQIKKLDKQRKEEETRRYFEEKYGSK